jgi:hypothetical protein
MVTFSLKLEPCTVLRCSPWGEFQVISTSPSCQPAPERLTIEPASPERGRICSRVAWAVQA